MRILDIERFPIALRPKHGAEPEQTIVVRVVAEGGLSGLGEAADAGRTLPVLLDWLTRYGAALAGANALNLNVVNRILDEAAGQNPPGCAPARAAIDMAVHDLVGKARGCSVQELLGGAYRTKFELFATIEGEDVDRLAEAARAAVGRGHRGLKVSIGDAVLPPAQTAAKFEAKRRRLAAVLQAVGPDVYVDADANQSLGNPALVRSMVEALMVQRFHVNLAVQQPLAALDFAGHALLREKLPVAVVLKQSVTSPEAMMQIERLGAADRIALSLERVGGLQNAIRVADICEAAAVGVSVSAASRTRIGAAAHCHLAATLHDSYPMEIGVLAQDAPVRGGFELQEGHAVLGDGPGLGVTLDEEVLRAFSPQRAG